MTKAAIIKNIMEVDDLTELEARLQLSAFGVDYMTVKM